MSATSWTCFDSQLQGAKTCLENTSTMETTNFREYFINLKGSNLKVHYWSKIAKVITHTCSNLVDKTQCKTKIEHLKKNLKQKEEAQRHTSEQPNSESHFDMMSSFMQ